MILDTALKYVDEHLTSSTDKGTLYWRSFKWVLLGCLGEEEANQAMEEDTLRRMQSASV